MEKFIAKGLIQETVETSYQPPGTQPSHWCWFEHPALFCPGYPHESTALQLWDAGLKTLEIVREAVKNGWTLKDASAWNVLYSNGRGVFVDVLSFEEMELSGTWTAYGQFIRNFLLPLLIYKKLGITPAEIFLNHRDGVTPEHARRLLSGRQLLSWPGIEFVLLPSLLARPGDRVLVNDKKRRPQNFSRDLATELVSNTLRRLARVMQRLRPDQSQTKSTWKSYEEDRLHYSAEDLLVKKDFLKTHMGGSTTVLDLGCNAGEYSILAAECGKVVVAADFDHPALSRLFARVLSQAVPITPVLVNIGRPTPSVGWQNDEIASFLERSKGKFDCIFLLGMIHHLLISERASLEMIRDLLDRLNPKHVILEWVQPEDRKFRQLAGLNQSLYSKLNSSELEACFASKFSLIAKVPLPSAPRVMYYWKHERGHYQNVGKASLLNDVSDV